jgi:hypothetical protein
LEVGVDDVPQIVCLRLGAMIARPLALLPLNQNGGVFTSLLVVDSSK